MAGLAKAFYIGLFCALTGLAVAVSPAGEFLESAYGLNWLFKLRGVQPPPADVVVVAIDRTAADALGLPNKPDRWPRALHTQLIDTLRTAGVAAIAFDILFREPRDDDMDRAFAAAIRRAGNVVLLENVISDRQSLAVGDDSAAALLAIEQRLPPLALFGDAAIATAPFPLPKVPVQIRQAWLFKSGAGDVPTLPMVAFQVHTRHAYDLLRSAIVETNPAVAARVPAREQLTNGHRLTSAMMELRALLHREPALAARLERLAHTGDPPALRTLIRIYREAAGSRYINFYGPPRTIRTIGIHELLDDPARAAELRGKTVFVGFADGRLQEQKDAFYTVYSRDDGIDLSGVEIAATVFANLLGDAFVQPLAPWPTLALLLLWGLVVGLLMRALPVIPAFSSAIALAGAYGYLSLAVFDARQLWLPLVIPLLIQTPLAIGIATLWRWRDTHRQRDAITRAFKHYLPHEVVEQFKRDGAALQAGGRELYGICLCTDAAQYTTLSESLDPTALAALMNDYYETVFEPIRRYGGFLSDIVGDSMLALWTARERETDIRRQACRAALEVLQSVERFNQRHRAHPLPTRIGVHCGPIVLGNIGALDHFEYRAVGDTVNTSNRIQALNKTLGTRLLVSGEMVAQLDDVTSRHLGAFLLPGKSRPLDIYALYPQADPAGMPPSDLTEAFGIALGHFRQQRWDDAGTLFADILTRSPHDGPSRFYQALCARYRDRPPAGAWSGVIEVGK